MILKFIQKIFQKNISLIIAIIIIIILFTIEVFSQETSTLQINNATKQVTSTVKKVTTTLIKETKQQNLKKLPLYNITSQKLWMDYRAITDTSSPQWSISRNGRVGNDGILRYNDYICIALGQEYGAVGDKFLIQIGEKKVKCILTDQKKYCDTLNGEGWLDPYGNLLEILVDSDIINSDCRQMGDMNYTPALNGEVTAIWKIIE